MVSIYKINKLGGVKATQNKKINMKTSKEQVKDLLNENEKSHLLERLEDVERDLSNLNHKRYELEHRQKYLLEKINKLDQDRQVVTTVAYIKQRNGL